MIVAVDQHGKEPGDLSLRLAIRNGETWPCPLQQLWQLGKNGGRIAARGRRLAGGKTDLALGHRKAGDAVEEADDLLALVAEVFGHRHGEPGGAAAARCGFV